jgi:hypothetical protein
LEKLKKTLIFYKSINNKLLNYKELDDNIFNKSGLLNLEGFRKKRKDPFFFRNQLSRLKVYNKLGSLFFGYKLHFVGRYSRKQRSSNF